MDIASALSALKDWVQQNESLLRFLGTASLVVLAVTVLALPVIVAALPEDYFVRSRPERDSKRSAIVAIVRNLVGAVLVLAGIGMLILPGQGALTILVGLTFMSFPGKQAFVRRIASSHGVGKTLNHIRAIAGRPPLLIPSSSNAGGSERTR